MIAFVHRAAPTVLTLAMMVLVAGFAAASFAA